jgi:DNA-binding GntR family transcriptional regulator
VIVAVTWRDFKARSGATYLYVQLADWVEAQIKAGQLQAGERLPAQRDIASLTGTSTELAGKAMSVLRERGLVETSIRGTFVAEAQSPEAD